jgi:hypothetical protein
MKKLRDPIRYEPMTDEFVGLLMMGLTSLQRLILRFPEVDASRGAGVIEEDRTKCLWTHDSYRIELTIDEGALMATISSDPDPLGDPGNRSHHARRTSVDGIPRHVRKARAVIEV